MRFDTRQVKPKLYDLAAVSLLAAFLAVVLVFLKQTLLLSVLSVVYLIAILFLLLRAFFRQLQYNPYSYNTIYYSGFAIFVGFVLVTCLFVTFKLFQNHGVEGYDALWIVGVFLDSAKNYMFISFPFLFLFSLSLCISNIVLIRKEGKSLTNFLGIILSILLIAGFLILFTYDFYASGSMWEVMMHDLAANCFAAIYLYFECMMIGTIIANAIAAKHEPEHDKDFMIILGCGLNKDGIPLPLLRGRIDRALEFYRRQKEETGKELIFVTSGGQGPDEIVSEAESMKRYLMEKGIGEDRIVKEDKSGSTFENMSFSKEKIMEIDPDGKVAFSTTNYHVFRAGLFARRVKMKAQGVGAETKWYFWPNAAVREFVGLLSKHRLKQALVISGTVLFYIVMTLVRYGFFE